MTNPIRLPRFTPTLDEKTTTLLPITVRLALTRLQPPDHIVAARQECAYQFLEEVFLPHLLAAGELTLEWLLDEAQAFKNQFKVKHPQDFRDFSLVNSIELKLELLQMSDLLNPEIADLVQYAYARLRSLIEKNETEIRHI